MKNLKKLLFLALFSVTFFSVNAQKEYNVDGIIVPRNLEILNRNLELNGFGIRSKLWLDIYVQSLYVSVLSQDPELIINSETEIAIRIEIKSSLVSSGKFSRNFNKGFERSAKDNLEALKPKIELFKALLTDVIVKNDVFVMAYNPKDKSVWVYKNNKFKGKVEGQDFKKALFGIWIGDDPVDEKLKKDLLGID
jgi:hypothetical protein